ncbi:hypothetical protein BK022_11140 [Methylorubrum extorquens]|uniref:Uncharacterized protein n=1 Tax=Methylorubrum extorquens TaxID=408 RepID=A0A1S1P656_METEX|nr:hypothetical protein BK022_11140 [Methylorubrum extorquens]
MAAAFISALAAFFPEPPLPPVPLAFRTAALDFLTSPWPPAASLAACLALVSDAVFATEVSPDASDDPAESTMSAAGDRRVGVQVFACRAVNRSLSG